jgi:uncharacterized protein (TIGR03083 family)
VALPTDTRSGMLAALRAIGGVITSAGILLAAEFAVLGVLPLIALARRRRALTAWATTRRSTSPEGRPMTPTAQDLVAEYRATHDRLVALVADLDTAALEGPSYDTEWSIGQVLSHVGSQAEIWELLLDAVLSGVPMPGGEVFPAIWDRWNAKSATEWRDDSATSNAQHLARLESLPADVVEWFRASMFGLDLDLAGFVRMRVSEHIVHAWDVAVALDPSATIDSRSVALLLPGLGGTVARGGRPSDESYTVRVVTTQPAGEFVVSVGETDSFDVAQPGQEADGVLTMPGEALLRLVYGRLDPDHTPAVQESGTRGLADLRAAFPGF